MKWGLGTSNAEKKKKKNGWLYKQVEQVDPGPFLIFVYLHLYEGETAA